MDRQRCRIREDATDRLDQRWIGGSPVDHRPVRGEVAVDGLGADDERAERKALRTGEPDVEQRLHRMQRQRARSRSCGLDRADAADEAVVTVELAVGGCDDEDQPGEPYGTGYRGARPDRAQAAD